MKTLKEWAAKGIKFSFCAGGYYAEVRGANVFLPYGKFDYRYVAIDFSTKYTRSFTKAVKFSRNLRLLLSYVKSGHVEKKREFVAKYFSGRGLRGKPIALKHAATAAHGIPQELELLAN